MKEKLKYNKGIYDGEFPITQIVNGKRTVMDKVYSRWERMLHRCYGKSTKKDRPTYEGCSVCDEWLVFSNFKMWIEDNVNWSDLHLDKDLLIEDNKVYSPDACVLAEPRVNLFLTLRNNHRGPYPLGVTLDASRKHSTLYQARINMETDVRKCLGLFKTPAEAHHAWQLAKRDRALQLQSEQVDERVIGGLQRVIDKLQYDYDNNLETKTL